MIESFPLIPNISLHLAEIANIINNPNYPNYPNYFWMYYERLNGKSLPLYLQSSKREFAKPWGIQGYFELPINPIPYDGLSPIGLRIGYAKIESDKWVNQNNHLHPYSPEVLFLLLDQGEAYFSANGKRYPLPNGPSVVVVPPGVPHDIIVLGRLYTMDVKTFDTNRIDGLSEDGLSEPDTTNDPNFNPIKTGPVFVDALSHGVPIVYNPNDESLLELAKMGYNCGWLVSIDPREKFNFIILEKKIIGRGLIKNYYHQKPPPLTPALFIGDFDLTLSR